MRAYVAKEEAVDVAESRMCGSEVQSSFIRDKYVVGINQPILVKWKIVSKTTSPNNPCILLLRPPTDTASPVSDSKLLARPWHPHDKL